MLAVKCKTDLEFQKNSSCSLYEHPQRNLVREMEGKSDYEVWVNINWASLGAQW